MKTCKLTILLLAAAGLLAIIVSCAQMKTIPALSPTHPEALAIGQHVNCAECHEDTQKGTMKAYNAFSHSQSFAKNHRFYAVSDDRLCTTCHKSSFCNDCHTNKTEMKPSTIYGYRPDRQMQHRGNFVTMHKIEGKLDPASCYRCHGRANNDKCVGCHK